MSPINEHAWLVSAMGWCAANVPVPLPQEDDTGVAWLAGILEGEGSFMYTNGSPEISVQMVDDDVIERVRILLGSGRRAPWQSKLGNRRLVFTARLSGARAVLWMLVLYEHLGTRRRAKIREVVDAWTANGRPKARRGERWPATCHPDRVRVGFGLCDACYMRKWRRDRAAQLRQTPSGNFGASVLTIGP